MELFGIRLLGFNEATAGKLTLTLALLGVRLGAGVLARAVVRMLTAASTRRDRAKSREVLRGLESAGIGIASTLYEIVGLPPLHTRDERQAAA